MTGAKIDKIIEISNFFEDYLHLIGCGAGDAEGDDAVADGVELGGGGFEEALGGRLTVDGVDHYLLGSDGLHCLQPRPDIFLSSIIY